MAEQNWGYLCISRMRHPDNWGRAIPEGLDPRNNIASAVTPSAYSHAVKKGAGARVIAFDGARWVSGYSGRPLMFLDPAKHDTKFYSEDASGRSFACFHGHVSQYTDMPHAIPVLSNDEIAQLHERHVLPTFNHPDTVGVSIERTAYQSIPTKPLEDCLSKEAIDALRHAHQNRAPIGIIFDPEKKTWEKVAFSLSYTPEKPSFAPLPAHIEPTKVGEVKALHTVEIPPPPHNIPPKTAEMKIPTVKSFSLGKAALIGGALVVAGGVGYWVLRHKEEQKHNQSNQSPGR